MADWNLMRRILDGDFWHDSHESEIGYTALPRQWTLKPSITGSFYDEGDCLHQFSTFYSSQ